MESKVLFFTVPLSVKVTEMEKILDSDPILSQAIIEYSYYIKDQGIETFKTDRNMIITETGYRLALHEKDVEQYAV